ncbi:uncharacterized protein LOC125239784 [Leguminivora glycinivorella]|uniref:uncharacterized protein LOC125239784 n=1 Tax=Leguminivora glycinivorella TaxID=1035111 RepID=UPI002010829E|nr:uncharacterized protein LOC125239784 [Leguminivora glycinivorella]
MKPSSSDMEHKINEEKLFKQKVLKSAEAVRKKVKRIRDVKSNDNMMLEAMLKPITDPLGEMVKKHSSNDNNLIISDSDFDNDRFKWNKPVKTLKYSPSEDGMKESLDNKTLLRKSFESEPNYSENELNDSDSSSQESVNQSDSDTTNNISFRTSDSFPSPRDDPAWQKQYFIMNIPFGVRNERGKLMLGSYPISVNDDKLVIGGESYFLTQGLHDLLFKKVPDLKLVTEDDKRLYKTLLMKTNAHRRDFDPKKPIKSNKGMKYLNLIKPLFKLSKQRTVSEEYISGKGLPSMKKVKRDISYVYWDDPNELVDRLKLLIASRDAGNTGLDNEIISIIEELREAGLINNI